MRTVIDVGTNDPAEVSADSGGRDHDRPASMSARDLLVHQFGLLQATAAFALDGLSGTLATGNAARATKILERLMHVQDAALELIGAERVQRPDVRTGDGSKTVDAIPLETLVLGFLASGDRCVAGIAALSDEALADPVSDPFGLACCRAELLGSLANDQAYHIGQLEVALGW